MALSGAFWTAILGSKRIAPPPTIPGMTLFAWYSPRQGNYADTSRTIPAVVGDHVLGVTDLSGNGNHLSQSVTSSGPILGTGYWAPDGIDDCWLSIALSAQSQPILTGTMTMITINPGSPAFIVGQPAAVRHRVETTGAATVNAGSTVTVGTETLNLWHILTAYFSGASTTYTFDGVSGGPISPGTGGLAASALGVFASNTGVSNFFGGRSKDIILYTGTATDQAAARAAINAWFLSLP